MAPVTDGAVEEVELNHLGSLAVTVLAGAMLILTARTGAVALLVAVAVVQAVLTLAWVFGTALPGRKGALLITALAAGGADVTVSLWPGGRLGTLLIVFGLAVPVMFVHQLMRGAARVRLVESLGGLALIVVAVVALPALLQLRHEFSGPSLGGRVVAGVVAAAAGALVVGYLVDLVLAAPRFDPAVARGLLAVIASAGLGGSIGHLTLRADAEFLAGRGAFTGAALGALIAFFAVGVAFVERSAPVPQTGYARRLRPVLSSLLPLSMLAPVAFVLCLAIRV
ncbi:MAG: hypothetical protein DLM57_13990 [Pseudonocardiales bacterium]|nr:MAG: hypothetical protein DLM57_13990 [Pseudonocardiales bacterium]